MTSSRSMKDSTFDAFLWVTCKEWASVKSRCEFNPPSQRQASNSPSNFQHFTQKHPTLIIMIITKTRIYTARNYFSFDFSIPPQKIVSRSWFCCATQNYFHRFWTCLFATKVGLVAFFIRIRFGLAPSDGFLQWVLQLDYLINLSPHLWNLIVL